jgi:hypothetical protein
VMMFLGLGRTLGAVGIVIRDLIIRDLIHG